MWVSTELQEGSQDPAQEHVQWDAAGKGLPTALRFHSPAESMARGVGVQLNSSLLLPLGCAASG